jgi:hypothetical protein
MAVLPVQANPYRLCRGQPVFLNYPHFIRLIFTASQFGGDFIDPEGSTYGLFLSFALHALPFF